MVTSPKGRGAAEDKEPPEPDEPEDNERPCVNELATSCPGHVRARSDVRADVRSAFSLDITFRETRPAACRLGE